MWKKWSVQACGSAGDPAVARRRWWRPGRPSPSASPRAALGRSGGPGRPEPGLGRRGTGSPGPADLPGGGRLAAPSSPAAPAPGLGLTKTPQLAFKKRLVHFPGSPLPRPWNRSRNDTVGARATTSVSPPARQGDQGSATEPLPLIFFFRPGTFLESGVQDSAGQRAFVRRLAGEGRVEVPAGGTRGSRSSPPCLPLRVCPLRAGVRRPRGGSGGSGGDQARFLQECCPVGHRESVPKTEFGDGLGGYKGRGDFVGSGVRAFVDSGCLG